MIDLEAVGRPAEPFECSWTERDALLYAVGVGAGQADPSTELAFSTENSLGVRQRVLPTFAVILTNPSVALIGDVPASDLLHAEQAVTVHHQLPVSGRTRASTAVTGIYDKGEHALVTLETELRDLSGDLRYASLCSAIFVRGAGGWGGERGPSSRWTMPERPADVARSYDIALNQALVYRLSGDRNPLHSDPKAAERSGFSAPILHGLCTYGYAGRALLDALCEGEGARFGSMAVRFATPVRPGQRLNVDMWRTDAGAVFRASTDAGVVLDRGVFRYAR